MNEEIEHTEAGGGESSAAIWAALAAADGQKADRFLEEQTEFVRLQKEHLHEQRGLILSHLRWQRFDDQLMGALKVLLLVLGGAVVTAIAAAVWNASQADGLVIDQFSVPPSLANSGMTGEALTQDFTAKFATIRDFANENSFSRSKEVSADRKEAVRIEIPQVGISLSDAWRFLRDWLGHERHISGSLRDIGAGKFALTASVFGAPSIVVTGRDLDALEQETAEKTFGVLDPVNIVNYFFARRQTNEAMAAAAHFGTLAATPMEKSDSYALWCYTTAYATGDVPLAIARCRIGIELDPKLAAPRVQLAKFLLANGWDEQALQQYQTTLTLKDPDQMPGHRGIGFELMRQQAQARIANMTGDFANTSWDFLCGHFCREGDKLLVRAESAARLHDAKQARALEDEAIAAGASDNSAISEVEFWLHAARAEWRAAVSAAETAKTGFANANSNFDSRYSDFYATVQFDPLLAKAEAELHNFREAHRIIDETPADCYACIRARGLIAEREDRPAAAIYWYARAVSEAPSIPFAYADWGAMLLRKGDFDGAIPKFREANLKGPHFADPLEMWGEALMQKNRSDLALARFEEANEYAPNWGRLHLEWGKALYYAGMKDAAKKEIARAAALDLSLSDRIALAAWTKNHE